MKKLSKKINVEIIQKIVIWFILYAMVGWFYEVFLEVVVYRWGFSNRGVLLRSILHCIWFWSINVYTYIKSNIKKDRK